MAWLKVWYLVDLDMGFWLSMGAVVFVVLLMNVVSWKLPPKTESVANRK